MCQKFKLLLLWVKGMQMSCKRLNGKERIYFFLAKNGQIRNNGADLSDCEISLKKNI